MAGPPASIVCPTCGKTYAFKPALAGKRVKCKCGGVIAVPAAPAAERMEESAEATPPGFEDMDFGAGAAAEAPPANPGPLASKSSPRGAAPTAPPLASGG